MATPKFEVDLTPQNEEWIKLIPNAPKNMDIIINKLIEQAIKNIRDQNKALIIQTDKLKLAKVDDTILIDELKQKCTAAENSLKTQSKKDADKFKSLEESSKLKYDELDQKYKEL